jgi:hypothetical protein
MAGFINSTNKTGNEKGNPISYLRMSHGICFLKIRGQLKICELDVFRRRE